MINSLYQALLSMGYTHPLHSPITHLPVGLIIGGFIFGAAAGVFKQKALLQTAHHCMVLALIAVPPTVLVGVMDWQQYYAGAWLFPIKMKLALVALLELFLGVSVIWGFRKAPRAKQVIPVYAISLLIVVGVGYFGGELVYGVNPKGEHTAGDVMDQRAAQGAVLFRQSCSGCHYPDKTDTNVGPGLKGLYQGRQLPVSGWPMTDAIVRRQIKTPFDQMPSFESLSDEQMDDLIAYLKTF